ncbi:unnamed protein product, partial [Heterosigma akashiwo]
MDSMHTWGGAGDDVFSLAYVDPAEEVPPETYYGPSPPACPSSSKLLGKPTDSFLNLEAAIGSTLASAIDKLDIEHRSMQQASSSYDAETSDSHLQFQSQQDYQNTKTKPTTEQPLSQKVYQGIQGIVCHKESRGLILLNVGGFSLRFLVGQLEIYGSILYTIENFKDSHGLLMVCYHDVRSATKAIKQLPFEVQSASDLPVQVRFCRTMDVGNNLRGCVICRNLPASINNPAILDVMARFGEIKSFSRQANLVQLDGDSFVVEFFDSRATSRALSELRQNLVFGERVSFHHFLPDAASEQGSENLKNLIQCLQADKHGRSGLLATIGSNQNSAFQCYHRRSKSAVYSPGSPKEPHQQRLQVNGFDTPALVHVMPGSHSRGAAASAPAILTTQGL